MFTSVLKSHQFNKRVEDFPSLRDYNDYLEEVEDMIDVPAIEARIGQYQRENAEQIMNAQARKAEEFAAALAASKGQPVQTDVDMTTGTASQFGVATSDGHYVPAVAGGTIPQPRPTQPLPMGSGDDLHAYHMDGEETMRLKAERGGKAGGWSLEISRKRALEEAFASIWI
ncbi:putative cdk-activating kinase assembly factor MAT1, centre [Helianthus annuus]|nr:putative cdk-activating kinase assembly factor MAT1, centre [Helianthus annuus]